MGDAVTFQLGAGTGKSRKRRRAATGAPANGAVGVLPAGAGAFAHSLTAGEAGGGSDVRADDGDPPVVVESVDVVTGDASPPQKRGRSPPALPGALDGGGGARPAGGAPVSQIARLIERRRRKVSAGALDEDAAYRMDLAQCPDEATSDAYSRVPVETFGASLLKRMGWDGKPDARSEALAGAPVSRLRGGEPEQEAAPDFRRTRPRVPLKTDEIEAGAETELARSAEKIDSKRGTGWRASEAAGAPLSGEQRDTVRGARHDETGRRAPGYEAGGSKHAYGGESRREAVGEQPGEDARSEFDDGMRARRGHHRGEYVASDRRRHDREVDRNRRSSDYASRLDDRYGSDRSRDRAARRGRDDGGRRREEDERFAPRTEDRDWRKR